MMLIDKKKTIDVLMAEYRECSKDADEMGGEAVLLADGIDSAIDIVRRMPTIDPVKHGRWLNFYGNYSTAECSCCGSCFEVTFDEEANAALWAGFLGFYKFCPNCGARMDANE